MNTPPELVPILVNPRHLVLGQKLFFYGMVIMMIGVLVAGLLGWLKPAEKPRCYHIWKDGHVTVAIAHERFYSGESIRCDMPEGIAGDWLR